MVMVIAFKKIIHYKFKYNSIFFCLSTTSKIPSTITEFNSVLGPLHISGFDTQKQVQRNHE